MLRLQLQHDQTRLGNSERATRNVRPRTHHNGLGTVELNKQHQSVRRTLRGFRASREALGDEVGAHGRRGPARGDATG